MRFNEIREFIESMTLLEAEHWEFDPDTVQQHMEVAKSAINKYPTYIKTPHGASVAENKFIKVYYSGEKTNPHSISIIQKRPDVHVHYSMLKGSAENSNGIVDNIKHHISEVGAIATSEQHSKGVTHFWNKFINNNKGVYNFSIDTNGNETPLNSINDVYKAPDSRIIVRKK